MFVCNIKVNKSKIFKTFFIIIAIIIVILFGIAIFRIFQTSMKVRDEIPNPEIANLSENNYTNVLKSVSENLEEYVGQKIHFTGYVYRAIDFSDDEFVIARDMVVDSNNTTLIVGFLCKSKDAKKYPDKAWVEITGTIQKGVYHLEIPVIQIESIKETKKPEKEFVYPPDDYYVPTSILF